MGVTEVKSAAPDREKLRMLLSFARRVVVGLRDHGGPPKETATCRGF